MDSDVIVEIGTTNISDATLDNILNFVLLFFHQAKAQKDEESEEGI